MISVKGNQFIFIDKIDHQQNRAKGVFIQKDKDDMLEFLYAREAQQRLDPGTGRKDIVFLDGCAYELPRSGKEGWSAMEFNHFTLSLRPKEITPSEYKIKAASSIYLARSKALPDIAELQWRFWAPLSAILLALLGVPLSRTIPAEGKYAKVAAAMFIFAFYYSLGFLAKIWVEQRVVPPLPGHLVGSWVANRSVAHPVVSTRSAVLAPLKAPMIHFSGTFPWDVFL